MPMLAQLIDDVVANKFLLEKPEIVIGRHPNCDIQINDIAVSGKHALIEVEQNQYMEGVLDVFISDKGSTNGTFVNDEKVSGRRRLNNNDVVRVAWNAFTFIDGAESTLEKTAYTLDD
ncbi:FHA domain-containing protein [Hahella aquimaris]|uniref:FHA domain-containing protein n=1 Tax=Hahella sp. HNIBRBA332 TaxID=3015983 RepID=UPI00273CA7A6|nr:FHA domain-containing protein [Hahella sp. HNIBRBA332]WLQ11382.1 FHA domain-containing protein [Hahella sp. HNIBRBA332]